MKNLFRKAMNNVRTNMQCRETRVVSALCLATMAFSIVMLAAAPFI